MDQLKLKEPEQVTWDYDRDADVLYTSFGEPCPSLTLDLGGGLSARYQSDTADITRFTVLSVTKVVGRSSE